MPRYHVIILPLAEKDITENADYIYYEKEATETAMRILEGLRQTIAALEFMPQKHEVDEDEELAKMEIRKCYYKNYKIFFYVDTDNCKVFILRVLHMRVNAKPLLLKYYS
jgi:plasmid stabilization system protein ParE